ncbi:uncharacterized protein B0H18DRAFT_381498 [Fomitopsis serialis]|uniref:uncharacterized protein n=1 Tax=Fomitopsis serialis TaxID=139415 RepID=UPI002007231A|nr:uncharacterized protein B0H18DRAFT_381498 [Neoantrodia serialis]KAH9925234.1 hypothetical protein B0H18DRAFT_381498 [Neoantrodia serialis]
MSLRESKAFEIATRVSTVVGDALVLLATWRVTYGVKRMSHLTKSDIPLTLLLLRDGTLYFGSLLVLNIFSAVCWAKIPAIQDFDNFIYSFTTLLLSRLFFNLREVSLLQSTLRADQASGDADMHTLSWEPAERAGVSQGPSALQFWSYSTAFGSLGGSLAFTDEEQAASTTTKEKNAGMPRDFADYDGTSNSDSSPALASGKDEEGASGDVEMAVLETWPS